LHLSRPVVEAHDSILDERNGCAIASPGDAIEDPKTMARRLTGRDLETENITAEGLALVNDRRIGNDDSDTATIQLRETLRGEQRRTRFMNERYEPVIAEVSAEIQVSDTHDDVGLEGIRSKRHKFETRHVITPERLASEVNYISHRTSVISLAGYNESPIPM
jgi:hypothetical protein